MVAASCRIFDFSVLLKFLDLSKKKFRKSKNKLLNNPDKTKKREGEIQKKILRVTANQFCIMSARVGNLDSFFKKVPGHEVVEQELVEVDAGSSSPSDYEEKRYISAPASADVEVVSSSSEAQEPQQPSAHRFMTPPPASSQHFDSILPHFLWCHFSFLISSWVSYLYPQRYVRSLSQAHNNHLSLVKGWKYIYADGSDAYYCDVCKKYGDPLYQKHAVFDRWKADCPSNHASTH